MNPEIAETTIRDNIRSIKQDLQPCRFRLFATHYPIWRDMIAGADEQTLITTEMPNKLQEYLCNAESARLSFASLRLTELPPGELLDSTSLVWKDVSAVVAGISSKGDPADSRLAAVEKEVYGLLRRNEVYPGGDQEAQNSLRRKSLRRLAEHLSAGNINRSRVLSVSPLPRRHGSWFSRSSYRWSTIARAISAPMATSGKGHYVAGAANLRLTGLLNYYPRRIA